MQIGDDWPGLFLRGDDTIIRQFTTVKGAARLLHQMQDAAMAPDASKDVRRWSGSMAMYARLLDELATLLESPCVEVMKRSGVEPVRLKRRQPDGGRS